MSSVLVGFAGALFSAWAVGLGVGFFVRRIEFAVSGLF